MLKKVLLATRPLVPPWDEASKNFAYFLGCEVKNQALTLLTTNTALTGLPEQAIQMPVFKSGHFNFLAKLSLFRFLRSARDQYDITHYLFTPTKQNTDIIKSLAFPTNGKTLQTVATLRDDLYAPEELKSMLFADRLVVYTDRSKEKLTHLGFTNVTRIYPGIDLNRYQYQPKDADLLTSLGLTQDHFVVIYPGEYMRLGATDMLTDFCVDYFTHNPDTNLRFVFACRIKNEADAEKKNQVQEKLRAAGVLAYVVFSDTISDMPKLYNLSDVVIFPVGNLNGKFDVPLIIVEAYACQKPVILSDLPQFAEFSNDAICVTVPKDSKEELSKNIAYLKDNSAVCTTLGKSARHFVEEHFDLKNTARQYEAIYTELAD
jgi:glycosyltransferase involved in cell wall biosynthesis